MKLPVALRRLLKFCLACFALLLIIIAIFVATSWHCDLRGQLSPVTAASNNPAAAKINDYARPEDDAYLGYPEWYIVWSYQEKADFQQQHLPSGFPFFGAVRQYWSSYCCISKLIRGKYPSQRRRAGNARRDRLKLFRRIHPEGRVRKNR